MRTVTGWVSSLGRLLVCGLAAAALLAGPVGARAAGVKNDLTAVAAQVATTVGDLPVRVGTFTTTQRLGANASDNLAKELTNALKKKNVKVEDGARLVIDGDFRAVRDEATGLAAVQVNFRLRSTSEVLLVLARKIAPKNNNDNSVSDLLGVTFNKVDAEEQAVLRAMLKDPPVTISGGRVLPRPRSPVAIELQVKDGDDFVTKEPQQVNGRAFVRLKKDDVFHIRLINTSKVDVAVTLDIDGINLFAFCEEKDALGDPKYSFVVVKANSATTIKGWYKTRTESAEFAVKDVTEGAGSVLKSASTTGRICATFAVAAKVRGQAGAGFNATQAVVGAVREKVVIRYAK
jgi:hypothetical protein